MATAVWKDQVIADSATVEEVEGNLYFPPDSVHRALLEPSEKRTHCPWKGEAHYYHILVGNACNVDAAWFYPEPKPAASRIKGHVAFWRGVTVAR
jgi:uncharacterized protein (DUF427 family)